MLLDRNSNTIPIIAVTITVIALLVLLPLVFSGAIILPQSFSAGRLTFHYYGLIMAVAVSAGYWLARRRFMTHGIDSHTIESALFWVIVGGFLGARLYHVASSFPYYANYPLEIIQVWKGGLSIYGAVFGGAAALAVFRKFSNLKLSIWILFDCLTPGIILGQIIGRFGNMFNYELYGYPTELPWGMYVPEAFRQPSFAAMAYFHPLFLYESLFMFVVFVLLSGNKGFFNRPGRLFSAYLFLYNAGRFFLEFMRIDSVFFGSMRINALVSVLLALLAIIVLYRVSHDQVS